MVTLARNGLTQKFLVRLRKIRCSYTLILFGRVRLENKNQNANLLVFIALLLLSKVHSKIMSLFFFKFSGGKCQSNRVLFAFLFNNNAFAFRQQDTAYNISAHGFSLTHIFPYEKMRVRENPSSDIFYAVRLENEFPCSLISKTRR